jgi:hypothetical protein
MLSRIDEIIYPNRCEVIEFSDPQRFVYPIFKNGSSSLTEYARQQGYKTLFNEQIKRIPIIDVVLRDPLTRFISGFNTYVYNTKHENPQLDVDTIIYFAENYLFLNRHYSTQLSWIINLSRFTNKQAVLHLHDMSILNKLTPLLINPIQENILSSEVVERLKNNIHNEMYQRLDHLLLELIGKEVTVAEILAHLKFQDPIAYSKLSCIALD